MAKGVPAPYPLEVVWEGGRRYRGGRPGGPSLLIDGGREEAPGPVDGVLIALAACSAADVVAILEKRRTPPDSLSVRIEFARAADPPRRLTAVRLGFRVVSASARSHVERAVALSVEKYCSVSASLAPDVEVVWAVDVAAADGAAEAWP